MRRLKPKFDLEIGKISMTDKQTGKSLRAKLNFHSSKPSLRFHSTVSTF